MDFLKKWVYGLEGAGHMKAMKCSDASLRDIQAWLSATQGRTFSRMGVRDILYLIQIDVFGRACWARTSDQRIMRSLETDIN
jgi:hypothetical protein